MLKRNLISFAIIVSGLFLANSAYGQSAPKGSMNRSTQNQTIKSPRDIATGQLIDTSTGEIVWARSQAKMGNFEIQGLRQGAGTTQNRLGNFEIQDLRSNGRGRGLIDTSTGEIVWADEVRSTRRNRTAVDTDLAALINW